MTKQEPIVTTKYQIVPRASPCEEETRPRHIRTSPPDCEPLIPRRRLFQVPRRTRRRESWQQSVFDGLQKNDPKATALFFEHYAYLLYGIGMKALENPAEAEDFVQEMIIYLAQQRTVFDPSRATVRQWVKLLATHRAVNRRRKLRLRQRIFGRSSNSLRFWPQPSNFSERIAIALDVERLLENSSLSDRQLCVVKLMVEQGLTLSEIASEPGVSYGNVRHDYYSALEKMRRTADGTSARLDETSRSARRPIARDEAKFVAKTTR
jgi:RNA polymerase sigma-70 factor, ECF subfamily